MTTVREKLDRAASGVPTYVDGVRRVLQWFPTDKIKPRPYISVLLWFPQLKELGVPIMCGHWTGERFHGCGLHSESREQPSHWATMPAGPNRGLRSE
jgi:hypothetical protein